MIFGLLELSGSIRRSPHVSAAPNFTKLAGMCEAIAMCGDRLALISQSSCQSSGKHSFATKPLAEVPPKFPWASMSQYSSVSSKRARFTPMPAISGSIWSASGSG